MTFIPGDPWVICDVSGLKVRMSQTLKTWDGLRVFRRYFNPRHPLLDIRGIPDDPHVEDARPEPADRFLDTNEVTRESF